MVVLDRFIGRCKTLDDLSNRIFVSNRIEDVSISVFNIITKINESKT